MQTVYLTRTSKTFSVSVTPSKPYTQNLTFNNKCFMSIQNSSLLHVLKRYFVERTHYKTLISKLTAII